MALSTGDRIGAYEIVSLLGKGGMGEVYRARDSKLNRDVAIKVLPPFLAGDADYLARFRREAQTLALLNHPNIAAIYGLEGNAIVMELVEGSTLRGPLPLPEALAAARQIAEALEAAHEKGIIHRDLKPGNVIVTPAGVFKVLDFGLAKAIERPSQTGPDSPTLTMRATEAGLILGTASYMPPEQAAGKPVDRRADIWSFGVVLRELLTGKRLFDGETVSHTLAHVLTAEIDVSEIPAGPIWELIRRCLDRNLKSRLQHIGEARIAIENFGKSPVAQPVAVKASYWPWAVAAVCLLAAGGGWYRAANATGAMPGSIQFLLESPAGTQFPPGVFPYYSTPGTALSPDGRYMVFNAESEGVARLCLRPLDTLQSRPLQGTEGAGFPFWSPDCKSVAFFSGGKIRRSDIAGGAPQVLCDAPLPHGGASSRDGVILIGSDEGLFRLPAAGGIPQQITQMDTARKESVHGIPQFLPGGKRFLYLIQSADPNVQGIYAGSLDNPKERLRILAAEAKAVYSPGFDSGLGFLLWLRDQTLLASPFDAAKLSLEGDATPLAEGLELGRNSLTAAFWTSDTGLLVYRTGGGRETYKLNWLSRDGKLLGEAVKENKYASIRLSPDGNRVAMDLYTDRAGGISGRWSSAAKG